MDGHVQAEARPGEERGEIEEDMQQKDCSAQRLGLTVFPAPLCPTMTVRGVPKEMVSSDSGPKLRTP